MPSVNIEPIGIIGLWEVKVKRFGVFISSLAEFYSAISPLRELQGYMPYDASLAVQLIGVEKRCQNFLNMEDAALFPSVKEETKELIRLRNVFYDIVDREQLRSENKTDSPHLSSLKDPVLKDGIERNMAEALSSTAHKLLILIQETINSLPLFLVGSRGILDINKLIESPEEALPDDVCKWIETNAPIAFSDLKEAGKCLAFGLATASGFHQMRFIEALLFPYYEKLPKVAGTPDKLRDKESQRSWFTYIEKLKVRNAKDSVIVLLTHLKDDYRNPLMHPEDTLKLPEATLLLGTVQGIANAVYSDMKDRNVL